MSYIAVSTDVPLLIVMNAGAGRDDSTSVQHTIEKILTEAGRAYRIFLIEDAEGSRVDDTAKRAVREAQACGGVVVAVGGDGTINTVANAVLGSGCPLGVIPQGTFNYFARTHGISDDLTEAIRVLMGTRAYPVQTGTVNDRLFLVNASLGLYPQLLEDREFYNREYGRSRLVAIWSGLLTVMGRHRQLRLSLEQDGRTRKLRTLMLFVGNNPLQLQQIGIPTDTSLDVGQLAAVVLRPVNRFAMLWLVMRGTLGTLGDAENVINFSFQRLTVKPFSLYRRGRIKVATDGESAWMNTPLEFRVSADSLYLMKPEPHLP